MKSIPHVMDEPAADLGYINLNLQPVYYKS